MAKPTAKIFVVGATGYLGGTVTEQLANAGLNVTALVRDLSGGTQQRQSKLAALKESGVQLLEGSLEGEPAELAQILKGYTAILSCVKGATGSEHKLVEAAKQAGTIIRFIPALWGGEYPTEGERANPAVTPFFKRFKAASQAVLDALKAADIPFTHVVPYAFFGWTLPAFGDFSPPGTPIPAEAKIYGTGDTPGAMTAEADIGRVVAKAIIDPRAANKKLIIKGQARTQNELIAAYEAASGKKLGRTFVSSEQLLQQLKGAQGYQAFVLSLLIPVWIDGVNSIPPEDFGQDPVVYADKLYPDVQYTTVEDYYRSQNS